MGWRTGDGRRAFLAWKVARRGRWWCAFVSGEITTGTKKKWGDRVAGGVSAAVGAAPLEGKTA